MSSLAEVVQEYPLEEPGSMTCQELEVLVAEEESCDRSLTLLKIGGSFHSG